MRVANYKLPAYFERMAGVENYNGTIRAEWYGVGGDRPTYNVWHWSTLIASYDPATGRFSAVSWFISQTTATLLGKVLRAMPRESVMAWIDGELAAGNIDGKRARQLRGQLWG